MELEQLRQLDQIARLGTMSTAAGALHVSQPSLSKSMRRLERDLGRELFSRTPNRVELNEAGRVALEHARAILSQERLLRDDLDALSRRQRTLRVAAVAPAPTWRLTALAVERFPGTILDPQLMAERDVEASLINRESDLAILLRPLPLPGVRSCPLMTEELCLSVPAGHRLAGRESARLADANEEPFLAYKQIGFWMDVVRSHLPDSELIVQGDRTVFLRLAASSGLCCFATDAPENAGALGDHVRVPLVDADAHATFFLCVRDDAPERAQQIADWARATSRPPAAGRKRP